MLDDKSTLILVTIKDEPFTAETISALTGIDSRIVMECLYSLKESGYVSERDLAPFGKSKFSCSPQGSAYIDNEVCALERERKKDIQYWITTVIAVVALILSIIK